MTLDPLLILDYLQRAGMVGLLILIVVGGARGVWVYGWYAAELRARIERLERQRDEALAKASRAVDVVEKVT